MNETLKLVLISILVVSVIAAILIIPNTKCIQFIGEYYELDNISEFNENQCFFLENSTWKEWNPPKINEKCSLYQNKNNKVFCDPEYCIEWEEDICELTTRGAF